MDEDCVKWYTCYYECTNEDVNACWYVQCVMEEGSGKVQSLDQCSNTLKQTNSQRHLCRLKCWLFWTLRILVKIVKSRIGKFGFCK